MKQIVILSCILLSFFGCKDDNVLEAEISKIETNFIVERFDRAFANAEPQQLNELKSTFPFLFSRRIPDSVWIQRMNDTVQKDLHNATNEKFGDFKTVTNDIQGLFQHLKYYDKTFVEPRVVTLLTM